jgi:hypothetical protein
LKPLYKYESQPFTVNLEITIENFKVAEKTKDFDYTYARQNVLYEHFRRELELKEVLATEALMCFIIFNLCLSSLKNIELYVAAIKSIAEIEEFDCVDMRTYLQYFKGYHGRDILKIAYEENLNG